MNCCRCMYIFLCVCVVAIIFCMLMLSGLHWKSVLAEWTPCLNITITITIKIWHIDLQPVNNTFPLFHFLKNTLSLIHNNTILHQISDNANRNTIMTQQITNNLISAIFSTHHSLWCHSLSTLCYNRVASNTSAINRLCLEVGSIALKHCTMQRWCNLQSNLVH